MMKKSILSLSSIMLIALFCFSAGLKADNPLLGSWTFDVQQAPWEYSKGVIIFENDKDDIITGKIRFDSGIEVNIARISKENEKVIFEVDVDGTPVKTVVTVNENHLNGFVETYEGNMPFTAIRKVPEN